MYWRLSTKLTVYFLSELVLVLALWSEILQDKGRLRSYSKGARGTSSLYISPKGLVALSCVQGTYQDSLYIPFGAEAKRQKKSERTRALKFAFSPHETEVLNDHNSDVRMQYVLPNLARCDSDLSDIFAVLSSIARDGRYPLIGFLSHIGSVNSVICDDSSVITITVIGFP
jgi:hypothetical protein